MLFDTLKRFGFGSLWAFLATASVTLFKGVQIVCVLPVKHDSGVISNTHPVVASSSSLFRFLFLPSMCSSYSFGVTASSSIGVSFFLQCGFFHPVICVDFLQ